MQGNLSGKPVNPIFALNSFSAGPFLQLPLPHHTNRTYAPLWGGVIVPTKLFLVVSPLYQRQLTGNYLYYGYSGGAKQELTIPTVISDGLNFRGGLRGTLGQTNKWDQWDSGSYTEIGFQYFLQRDILSGLTLVNQPLNQQIFCNAASTLTVSNCVSGSPWMPINPTGPTNPSGKPITIDGNTHPSDVSYQSVNAEGFYWDIHLTKQFYRTLDNARSLNLTLDTKGDAFFRRGVVNTLSTQTFYDVPYTVAIGFQVLPNLTFAPTYSGFLYSNQLSEKHLYVNNFKVTLRWYLGREARVPILRQLWFKGPASLSQSASPSHMK